MRDAGRRPMGRLCYWVWLRCLRVTACGFRATPLPAEWSGDDHGGGHGVFGRGSPAQGSLLISGLPFLTSGGTAVAAGTTNTTLGTNGALSVALVPNAGATPAGMVLHRRLPDWPGAK